MTVEALAAVHLASMQPGRLRPGNADQGATDAISGNAASMQPGRLRPGNIATAGATASLLALQCSRGVSAPETTERRLRTRRCYRSRFNAAGASPPRKPVEELEDLTGLPMLQCSRGVSAPETRGWLLRGDARDRASMQPGRLRPGNPGDPRRLRQFQGASMQPGRLRPGNGPCATRCFFVASDRFCECRLIWFVFRALIAVSRPSALCKPLVLSALRVCE